MRYTLYVLDKELQYVQTAADIVALQVSKATVMRWLTEMSLAPDRKSTMLVIDEKQELRLIASFAGQKLTWRKPNKQHILRHAALMSLNHQ